MDENGCYSNDFIAIPDSLPLPPSMPDLIKPVGHIEIAEVVDNDDPDELGRVKIKFYWQNSDAESVWVRVSTLYSGDRKRNIVHTRTRAQVIVGYEHNDPSQPVILGSLYPKWMENPILPTTTS